jgi:putative transposase
MNLPARSCRRINPRLSFHDYASVGTYFLTICTHDRIPLFGTIENGSMSLNECGALAGQCWEHLPRHFPHVALDSFVIMPDHVHGILTITHDQRWIHDRHGRTDSVLTTSIHRECDIPGSLGVVVRSFKSATTRAINLARNTPGARVWQRGYNERVIRNDDNLIPVRKYIANNPANWGRRKGSAC